MISVKFVTRKGPDFVLREFRFFGLSDAHFSSEPDNRPGDANPDDISIDVVHDHSLGIAGDDRCDGVGKGVRQEGGGTQAELKKGTRGGRGTGGNDAVAK